MENLFVLVFSSLSSFLMIDAARILGVIHTPSFSHQYTYRPLWRELSLRGHQVVVLTTDPMNDPTLTNLTEIDLHFSYIWKKDLDHAFSDPKNVKQTSEDIANVMNTIIEEQLKHREVKKLINDKNEHFDLAILEIITPTSFAFAERFNCPFIGVLSYECPNYYYNFVGSVAHPIANPDAVLPYESGKLTFRQRLLSFIYLTISRILSKSYIKDMDRIVKKHFGDDTPRILETVEKMSLLMLYTNPVVSQIRPLMPNIITIDGGTYGEPTKPLEKELKQVLDKASQGFIYFSLGSNVKSKDIPDKLKMTILETFSELPYKVLWKFELEEMPGKPDNVVISKWFPQPSILKHPNIKLFITHGGIQSIDEAIVGHVPMLTLPFVLDQHGNSKRIVTKGLGLSLDYKTLEKETFKAAILEVVNNPKYKNRAKELHDLAIDQPMSGVEKGIWWTEYVIRHKGAKHLRSPMLDLPYYQYFLLDVIGFCVLAAVVVTCAAIVAFKLICKFVRSATSLWKTKVKTS